MIIDIVRIAMQELDSKSCMTDAEILSKLSIEQLTKENKELKAKLYRVETAALKLSDLHKEYAQFLKSQIYDLKARLDAYEGVVQAARDLPIRSDPHMTGKSTYSIALGSRLQNSIQKLGEALAALTDKEE